MIVVGFPSVFDPPAKNDFPFCIWGIISKRVIENISIGKSIWITDLSSSLGIIEQRELSPRVWLLVCNHWMDWSKQSTKLLFPPSVRKTSSITPSRSLCESRSLWGHSHSLHSWADDAHMVANWRLQEANWKPTDIHVRFRGNRLSTFSILGFRYPRVISSRSVKLTAVPFIVLKIGREDLEEFWRTGHWNQLHWSSAILEVHTLKSQVIRENRRICVVCARCLRGQQLIPWQSTTTAWNIILARLFLVYRNRLRV
jgi:hypothetical protein